MGSRRGRCADPMLPNRARQCHFELLKGVIRGQGRLAERPDLGARLPAHVPIHLFYGSNDETTPFVHADLYARIASAQLP